MDFMNLYNMRFTNGSVSGILFLLLVVVWVPGSGLKAQTKKALLIGIGNYPAEGGWGSLSSHNDISLIKNTLAERGFQKDQILELADQKATRNGILDMIRKEFLNRVQANDIAYFHFSGHGQQKQDFEADELDGLDECIVPYDSPKKFQKGVYEGQNLITDDELGKALQAVRQKLGPKGQLFVVLDACHSGTGTRGMSRARGATEIMADPEFLRNKLNNAPSPDKPEAQFEDGASSRMAPMVVFSGSAPNQLNYEMKTEAGEQYGSLSYALAKHLTKAGTETSYRALFDQVRLEMSAIAPLQNPQCEGELDLEIANGKLLEKPAYYKTSGMMSDTEILVRAGEIHGLIPGTELGLFPPDTRDITSVEAYAKGRVIKAYPSESKVLLEKPVSREIADKAWVYVTQQSFGDLSVKLSLEITDQAMREGLESVLFSKSYITRDQQAPELLLKTIPEKDQLTIYSKEGYEIETIPCKGMQMEFIANKALKAVRRYMRGESMRKMELEGSDIRVSFKIIPVDSIGTETDSDKMKFLSMDASGVKKLTTSSKVRILIINEGIKPAYFNLIDLQPDNRYEVIIPGPNSNPEEMRILPDQKILFPTEFTINPPLGTEVFKLISSDKPIDLRSTANTRGIKKGEFESLFSEDASDESLSTRSASKTKVSVSDIHIYTDTFIIANSKK